MNVNLPLSMLEEIRSNLKRPDHTGAIEYTGKPGTNNEEQWRAVPLDRNNCACRLHRLHVRVRRAIAKAKA